MTKYRINFYLRHPLVVWAFTFCIILSLQSCSSLKPKCRCPHALSSVIVKHFDQLYAQPDNQQQCCFQYYYNLSNQGYNAYRLDSVHHVLQTADWSAGSSPDQHTNKDIVERYTFISDSSASANQLVVVWPKPSSKLNYFVIQQDTFWHEQIIHSYSQFHHSLNGHADSSLVILDNDLRHYDFGLKQSCYTRIDEQQETWIMPLVGQTVAGIGFQMGFYLIYHKAKGQSGYAYLLNRHAMAIEKTWLFGFTDKGEPFGYQYLFPRIIDSCLINCPMNSNEVEYGKYQKVILIKGKISN
jgi:hypothetical protein